MIKEDFFIYSEVRRILIRSNIDYKKIDIGTARGVVYLKGSFQLSHFHVDVDEEKASGITAKTLHAFAKDIRRVPGVSEIVFQFNNWRKEKGQWVPIEAKKEKDEDKTTHPVSSNFEGD